MALVAHSVAKQEPERLVDEMAEERAAPGRANADGQERIGALVEAREPRLHHRDERADRGEGELETDAEDRLRLQRDDRQHGEREIAHRQRAPVEDDGAEHDQRHDQRALGADARAGGDVVEDRAEHRDAGRPFLDGIAQRQRRRQREKAPREDEENAGDQRHLHAGDGDDVEDAGLANEVLGVVGEEIALARDHRRGDGALVAADDSVDAQGEAVARLIDRSEEALAPRGVARRRQDRDRAERRADRADAGEISVAREIVAAGQHRARRRQQPRLQRDIVAGGDIGRLARRHAHAARREICRHVAGVDDAEDEPRADGADVDFLDEALQLDDADMVEHRRLDARGAQAHREKAGAKRREADPDAEREGPRAGEPGERREDRRQQRRQPQHGLAIGRDVQRDAAHRGDGNPQEEPPLVDFFGQRPGEQRAPIRRQRRRAHGAGGGENAGARGGRHGTGM